MIMSAVSEHPSTVPHSCRSAVVSKVAPQVMVLAQHKYASNVVEACFKHGSSAQRDLLLR